MSGKKIFVALLIIIVAIGGFVAGLVLLRERQELREEASTPTGEAKVSISPETGNYEVGQTIKSSVYFNPANIAISGVAVRITYPFSGSTPEVTVSSIVVNPSLLSSGDWTCPTQGSILQGSSVIIDIACANTSASGFTANSDTLFADINLKVERAPSVSPLVLRFDNLKTVITRKSDNQDVALIPTSSGTYTIGGAAVTNTPTATPKITGTVTATPTGRLTATPTRKPSGTVTPTPTPRTGQLPDAGVSYPTIMGVALGILAIVGAILLAL